VLLDPPVLEVLLPTLVVEPDPLARRAVAALAVHAFGGSTVSVADAAAAAEALDARVFGAVLVERSSIEVITQARAREARVVSALLVSEVNRDVVFSALRAGVSAVVCCLGDPGAVVPKLRCALNGGLYLDDAVRSVLTDGPAPSVVELSPREAQVLSAVAAGEDLQAVASRLGIGVSTAKSHAAKAAAKLGTRSSREAARVARSNGLLDLADRSRFSTGD
jgi:DNA-binding NarL/FixJ family response regulator